jgi:nitroreductase
MMTNPVLDAMMRRRSVRKYRAEMPAPDVIEAIVRAAQQAPFAAQLGSLLLKRGPEGTPFGAPLLFTILVDAYRLERVMERRGWPMRTNDLSLLLFGIQDACYMAENLVIAAESLGMGSCFLGGAPYRASEIAREYDLPPRVFPLVQLAVGYPDDDEPVRPRYPLSFSLFEGRYQPPTDDEVEAAMRVMDEGYIGQDYYRRAGYMVKLEDGREETFCYDDYGWTEHMGRKWGQWFPSPSEILSELQACGFHITRGRGKEGE